jgi:hypothetical protein
MPTIDNWAAVSDDPYAPPEASAIVIKGEVRGHRQRPDGEGIRTSRIVAVEGRKVTTASGSVYELGEPRPEYRTWLRKHRPNWDPENPVTMPS